MTEERNGLPDLPQGWAWTTIDEIGELLRGVSYKKHEASKEPREEYVPVLRANNINSGLNFDDLVYVPRQRVKDEQLLRAGDIVICMSSGSKHLVGKASQAIKDFYGGFGAFCGLVRVSEELEEKYVGFFFQSPLYRNATSRLSSGVNINNLRRDHIESMPIPLPPLPEQQRIVAKIEELFTQLDAGVAALEKARAQLRRYRQAVLKAAVEGELTREWREAHRGELESASVLLERILEERRVRWEAKHPGKRYKAPTPPDADDLPALPEEWAWASVLQFSTKVTDGVHKTPEYVEEGVPFLSVTNISESGSLSFSPSKHITQEEHRDLYKRCNPERGDVLLSKVGTIGLTTSIDTDREFSLFVNVALIKPIRGLVSPDFVAIALRHGFMSRIYHSYVSGSNQKFIGTTKIGLLPIPMPPLAEQRRIVEGVEQRLSVADEMEKAVEQSLKRAERLRQSILKRAFEGKLVPQDPSDEPASVLLERIKAEKARREGEGKGKRKGKEKAEQLRML